MKSLSLLRALRLVSVGSLLLLVASTVQAQTDDCTQELQDAETAWLSGGFEQAAELLQGCAERDIPPDQREEVYRLMGITYLADNLEEQARGVIRQLLELVPNYEPNPVQDPAVFASMVAQLKAEMEAETVAEPVEEPVEQVTEETQTPPEPRQVEPARRGLGKWLIIGGVAVAGGTAAALLLGGGGGESELPIPPALPGEN